jgi:hypothetical protein
MENNKKLRKFIKIIISENLIKENKNYLYTNSDYERYVSLEKEIVSQLNKILPEDNFFASTWYRRSHENDYDLIFKEMHFPSKSDSTKNKKPFTSNEKELVKSNINQILNKYSIKSAKVYFDNKFRIITLKNFKDDKIKKINKGRESFEYPINGVKVKFIISDRDIVPFVGQTSLKSIFNSNETFSLDDSFKIVSYLSTHLHKFIKIYDEIYNLNDVESSYVKFFQDMADNESGNNVTPSAVLYKKYILNDLKTYDDKDIVDLFDMLETINYDFAYYDSLNLLTGKHYVRNL